MHYHMGRDMQRAFFLAGCSSALALFSRYVHAAVPFSGSAPIVYTGLVSFPMLLYRPCCFRQLLTSAIFIERFPSLSSTIRLRITHASESASPFFDPILPHMHSGLLNFPWPSSSALRPHIRGAVSFVRP